MIEKPAYIDLSDKELFGLLVDLADLSTDDAVTEALFEAHRRLALYMDHPQSDTDYKHCTCGRPALNQCEFCRRHVNRSSATKADKL